MKSTFEKMGGTYTLGADGIYSVSYTHLDVYKRQDDQKALMKDICKRLEIDTKMYKEKMFLNVISSAKDEICLLYTSRCV